MLASAVDQSSDEEDDPEDVNAAAEEEDLSRRDMYLDTVSALLETVGSCSRLINCRYRDSRSTSISKSCVQRV